LWLHLVVSSLVLVLKSLFSSWQRKKVLHIEILKIRFFLFLDVFWKTYWVLAIPSLIRDKLCSLLVRLLEWFLWHNSKVFVVRVHQIVLLLKIMLWYFQYFLSILLLNSVSYYLSILSIVFCLVLITFSSHLIAFSSRFTNSILSSLSSKVYSIFSSSSLQCILSQ